MRQTAKLLAVLSVLACLVGVVHGMTGTARADHLGNGYDITCSPNGSQAVCNISGCPRVHEQEAGDVVHVRTPGSAQAELAKSCNNTTTVTVNNATGPTVVSVQGCRKHFPGTDDCGSWSDYTFTPPAPAPAAANNDPAKLPVRCTGGPDAGKTLPPGSTCRADLPPVKCPAGSQADTVPAGQQCAGPANAVAMNISRNGFNANAAITNKSSLPAKCTYTATKTGGLGPQEVDRNIDVGANSTSAITDMLWPPLGTSYHAVAKCTVTYNGKQTSIGESAQNVSG